jgi:hypothetical protein
VVVLVAPGLIMRADPLARVVVQPEGTWAVTLKLAALHPALLRFVTDTVKLVSPPGLIDTSAGDIVTVGGTIVQASCTVMEAEADPLLLGLPFCAPVIVTL